MEPNKILIQINNVSFKYPAEDYLFTDVKLTVKQGDKTAIVGANGSGKSTLLKILTGKLELDQGTRLLNCKPYYVPQVDLSAHQKDSKIYEYILDYYEDWWDVLSETEKLFNLPLDGETATKTLSGGELMKLNLAIALKHNPDVLILDEPTNHLDIRSINNLINFINEDSKGRVTFIIVSHDTFFLDQVVTTIWELENKKITTYGGNYSFYKEQKALHLRGIKKHYDLAKDKLQKAKDLEQKDIEKQAKKANEAKRAFMNNKLNARQYGAGKDSASALQHGKSVVLERLMEDAEEQLAQNETEDRRLAFINLKNTKENANRTIFEIKDGSVSVGKTDLIKNINLKVTYGDRIVLAGNNGSGKTSLVKALLTRHTQEAQDKPAKSASKKPEKTSDAAELKGEAYLGNQLAWVYIDQRYSLIHPDLTLIENLMHYDTSVTNAKAKEQLGKFQFKTEIELGKLGKNLSGGEMVRLIMAMITSFPIDLIILDEPTNNLDVETVAVLVKSLNNFRGSIVVISHNIDFLHKINIKTAYMIKDKKIKLMTTEPGQKDAFYKALVS